MAKRTRKPTAEELQTRLDRCEGDRLTLYRFARLVGLGIAPKYHKRGRCRAVAFESRWGDRADCLYFNETGEPTAVSDEEWAKYRAHTTPSPIDQAHSDFVLAVDAAFAQPMKWAEHHGADRTIAA